MTSWFGKLVDFRHQLSGAKIAVGRRHFDRGFGLGSTADGNGHGSGRI